MLSTGGPIGRVLAGLVFLLVLPWLSGCLPGSEPEPVAFVREQCRTCHADEAGFSRFHRPMAIGCVSCHGGDPEARGADSAHTGMRAIPGNLADAAVSCGEAGCHGEIVDRVQGSLMATARGIVSVDRWVFGERPDPDGTDGITDLGDSPADTHLRQLCASCHLGVEKTDAGPLHPLSRGGGCLACHLTVDDGATHARLSTDVPSSRCFGCHSRSGRISMNYEGWHETVLGFEGVDPSDPTLSILADGRVVERAPADVHHEAGLECIDCHTSRETMGDGTLHVHQEQAVETTCTSCHSDGPPTVLPWSGLSDEDRRLVVLRSGGEIPDRLFLTSDRSGFALVNAYLDGEGRPVLEGKLDGRVRPLAAPAAACTRPGHERLSCQSCHSAWAPQCIGCHTQRTDSGRWVELVSDFRPDPPVLGVREGTGRIEPFIPGMIMTLNAEALRGDPADAVGTGSFHRLYAPSVPHTTSAGGRTCESCHLDPLAVGFGRGSLRLDSSRRWVFAPTYAPARDGLPADAWTPFLEPAPTPNATRSDARPMTPGEQWAVLRVGACLGCHPGDDPRWDALYADFEAALGRVTGACVVPRNPA